MSLFGSAPSADAPGEPPLCSRKGCRNDAAWQLLWNNPRIHTPERRKIWSSCSEHVAWFEAYLGDRGLWKETRPLTSTPLDTPAPGAESR